MGEGALLPEDGAAAGELVVLGAAGARGAGALGTLVRTGGGAGGGITLVAAARSRLLLPFGAP